MGGKGRMRMGKVEKKNEEKVGGGKGVKEYRYFKAAIEKGEKEEDDYRRKRGRRKRVSA
jgi:hypothetical protein